MTNKNNLVNQTKVALEIVSSDIVKNKKNHHNSVTKIPVMEEMTKLITEYTKEAVFSSPRCFYESARRMFCKIVEKESIASASRKGIELDRNLLPHFQIETGAFFIYDNWGKMSTMTSIDLDKYASKDQFLAPRTVLVGDYCGRFAFAWPISITDFFVHNAFSTLVRYFNNTIGSSLSDYEKKTVTLELKRILIDQYLVLNKDVRETLYMYTIAPNDLLIECTIRGYPSFVKNQNCYHVFVCPPPAKNSEDSKKQYKKRKNS